MSYFKRTFELTYKERRKVSEMIGKIMLWILEGRDTLDMAEDLKLTTTEVDNNIMEALYTFRKHVGRWNYIKILFRK